jgi:hypothetical protein
MSEKTNVYPKGILFFKKKDTAPSWVIGELIITPNQLFDWVGDNADQLMKSDKYGNQLKLTITEKGLQVNKFEPKQNVDKKNNQNDFEF